MTPRAGVPPLRRVAVWGLAYLAVAGVFLQLELRAAPGRADAPVSGDLLAYYYPSLRYGYSELAAGRLPRWNPHQAAGVPFIAGLHHGFFYPLYAPLLVLDAATALDLHLVLHLVIAGLGAFLFCRQLGMGSAAAFVAGLIYTYHGSMMIKVYFPDFLTSSAWIPYQFLLVDRVLQGGSWRSAAGLAAVVGLCFLGGHGVQFLYLAALAVLPLIAVRGVQLLRGGGGRAAARAAAQLAVAIGLGLLVGAVRIVPMAEFVAESWRPPDMGAWASLYTVSPPVWREGLLTPEPAPPGNDLAPNSADRLRTIYVGTLSLALALLGLAVGRPRPPLLAVAATGMATALYSLGSHGPLFPLLARLPLGTRFQGLDRALVLLGFAVAVLAAAGLDALLRRGAAPDDDRRRRTAAALAIAAALAAVVGLGLGLGAARGAPRLLAYGAAGAVALAAVRFGSARAVRGAGLALLAGVLLVDLFHAQQHRGRLPSQLDAFFHRNDALYEQIRARQGFDRTYLWSPFDPRHPLSYRSDTAKAGMVHGIWQATDYDPLCGARFTAYLDRLGPSFAYPLCYTTWEPRAENVRLIDLLGVRFFAVPASEEGRLRAGAPAFAARLTRVWSDGRVSLYEYADALPRAFLVDRVEAEPDPARVLDRLASLDARRVALVEGGPPPSSAGGGEAAIVAYEPNRVEVETRAAQPSFLVLTDQFDAGWRATVDGTPAPIFRTDYLFRGVPVPAGTHRVRFAYRPRSFVYGAAASGLGVVLLAVLWVVGRPRWRPAQTVARPKSAVLASGRAAVRVRPKVCAKRRADEAGVVNRLRRALVAVVIGTAGLCLLLEGGARFYLRLRSGRWPQTLAAHLDAGRARSNAIFQDHPFLNVGPRPGSATVASGRRMAFNRAGYRSPERDVAKPPGTYRIVAAGGSTTFDVAVPRDEQSWPWQLETLLAANGGAVQVWNAGFPGWTSLENGIALAARDVDLHPDLLILFQGINDLQPAAHIPFEPDYAGFHARIARQATGVEEPPLRWYQRSVFLERVLPVSQAWFGIAAPTPVPPPRLARLPDEALRVFERNVRSFIAVGRAHGARTLLVTQVVRQRAGARAADTAILEQWVPGLPAGAIPVELERLNDVLRRVAASGAASLADAARDVAWDDADFADPMHFSAAGSRKLAAYLAPRVAALRPAS